MINTFRMLWQMGAKRHKNIWAALCASFVRSSLGITQLLAVMAALSVITGSLDPKTGLIRVGILTAVCIVGGCMASYFEQINSIRMGMGLCADQRMECADVLKKVPLGFFSAETGENLVAGLTTTLGGVEAAGSMTIVGIVSGIFNALAFFVFMCFYEWRMGVVMLLGMVCYILVVNWQMKVSKKNAPIRQAAQTHLVSAVLSFLQGIRVTKAFSVKDGDRKLTDAIKESMDGNIGLTDRSMPSQAAGGAVIGLFEGLLILLALWITVASGDVTLEKGMVLMIFAFMSYGALSQAGSILGMIGMVESGLNEVKEIKKAPVLPVEEPEEKAEGTKIEVSGVSYSYGTNDVIKNVSFTAEPNEMTAIIGPSGSGKTTLCRLIARYMEAGSGKITLGGADIRHMTTENLMEKISMVFQNVYLFEDTVINNIRYARPDATLEEVREAARKARADEFIMALPKGYDTMIEEGGANLSGGEKQRISIARAILKDSPVIILDEATSALDTENERMFFDAVDELIEGRTVIMIAHRLQTLEHAQKIISLRDGEIVEEGSPAELRNAGGLYSEFLGARKEAEGWKIER